MSTPQVVRPKRTYFGPHDPFVECHDDTYKWQPEARRCGICGKSTHYKSTFLAEHICSVECSNELWCQVSETVATTSVRRRRGGPKS